MQTKSRGWLITGAVLSLFVGFLALSSPILFSFLIVRLLAVFAFVSGIISLLIAIFGKDIAARGLNAVFALVRIVAGLALLYCIPSGVHILTLVFGAFLMVEGVSAIFGAFKIRQHKGWIPLLLNGIVTLALGLMVLRPLADRFCLDTRLLFRHQLSFPRLCAIDARSFGFR
jgi:uncharacterized membrane protein HdeD (DUF308 family)